MQQVRLVRFWQEPDARRVPLDEVGSLSPWEKVGHTRVRTVGKKPARSSRPVVCLQKFEASTRAQDHAAHRNGFPGAHTGDQGGLVVPFDERVLIRTPPLTPRRCFARRDRMAQRTLPVTRRRTFNAGRREID